MDLALRHTTIATAVWVAILGIPTCLALRGRRNIVPYCWYRRLRLCGACVLPVLAFGSIYVVAQQVAQTLAPPAPMPWYTHSLILSFVIFWALFPPLWFCAEYSCIDTGLIGLPAAKKPEVLTSLKIYADFASKTWAAVGALLAVLLAFLK